MLSSLLLALISYLIRIIQLYTSLVFLRNLLFVNETEISKQYDDHCFTFLIITIRRTSKNRTIREVNIIFLFIMASWISRMEL